MSIAIHYNLKELSTLAVEILNSMAAKNSHILLLFGQMGAGKTELVRAIGRELGVQDDMCSPSYPIIQEYLPAINNKWHIPIVQHMDLYRLEDIEEAFDIGIEDYLYSDALCILEWPEIVLPLLPENTLSIYIQVIDDRRLYKME